MWIYIELFLCYNEKNIRIFLKNTYLGGDAMKPIFLRIYDTLLAALTVMAGLCLMAACLTVYRSGGPQPYTPEKVAQAFHTYAAPIWLWLALALIRGFVQILYPITPKSEALTPELTLQRLQQRINLDACPKELKDQVLFLRSDRKKDARNCLFLLLGCSAVFLFYGIDPSHYHADTINTSVITSFCFLLICITLPFIWFLGATRRARHSKRIELQLLKTAPASAKITPAVSGKSPFIAAGRWVLLAVALVLLVYGFWAGGTADVLTKAVNICTECVGLG